MVPFCSKHDESDIAYVLLKPYKGTAGRSQKAAMNCECSAENRDIEGEFVCEGLNYCCGCGKVLQSEQARISFGSEARKYSAGPRSAASSRNSMNQSNMHSAATVQFYADLDPLGFDKNGKDAVFHIFTSSLRGGVTRRERRKAFIVASVYYASLQLDNPLDIKYITEVLGYIPGKKGRLDTKKISQAVQAVGFSIALKGKQDGARRALETISGRVFSASKMASFALVPNIARRIGESAQLEIDTKRIVAMYAAIKKKDLVLSRMQPTSVIASLIYYAASGPKCPSLRDYSAATGTPTNTLKNTINMIKVLDFEE